MTATDLSLMLDLKSPWKVTDVKIDHAAHKIELRVSCEGTRWIEGEQILHIHSYAMAEPIPGTFRHQAATSPSIMARPMSFTIPLETM